MKNIRWHIFIFELKKGSLFFQSERKTVELKNRRRLVFYFYIKTITIKSALTEKI